MTGLYIHIPLCLSRCRYCDFYKVTPNEVDGMGRFLDALELELQQLPETFRPETVFIGGGTPTALAPEEYGRMLEFVRRQIDCSNVVEFTSEANPGTLDMEKLLIMREGGINRVSIGVQSFNDRALKLLGRIHRADAAVDGFRMLRDAGFDNVNIDLIQSIPGMKPADILRDVQQVIDLQPEHISYYNLIYESGTPMTYDRDASRICSPADDEEAENYYAVRQQLTDAGYEHYEISNFSIRGKPCLHNVLYWQGGEYFGCGPAAHSHWAGRRFGNVPDLNQYCERLERAQRRFDEIEHLSPEEKARETLVMWLRMTEGVAFAAFEKLTGYTPMDLCGKSIEHFAEEGLLSFDDTHLALTPKALFISDGIFSELV